MPEAVLSLAQRLSDSFAYLTRKEVDLIKLVAQHLPEQATCVNIGAGAGTSIIALLEERPDLRVYSVDINSANGVSQFQQAGIEQKITSIIGDSKEVLWQYGEIHWLFVDGGHLEHEVWGDIDAWLPRMAKDGFVLFHDYGSPNWDAVKRVVDSYAGNWGFLELQDTLIAFEV